jgi:hypothetical protein
MFQLENGRESLQNVLTEKLRISAVRNISQRKDLNLASEAKILGMFYVKRKNIGGKIIVTCDRLAVALYTT